MREIKEPKVRRAEILEVAKMLFAQKGFDGTSTNEILEKAGIARGTLYYHFKSKEDIMDALIAHQNTHVLNAAGEIAADENLSVIERLVKVILSLNISQDNGDMLSHLHKPQNALMHQKMQKAMIGGITPILTNIIREGIDQGLFHTPYPYECMEMMIIYADVVFDNADIISLTEEERFSRIEALLYNMERLLGAESGSLASKMMRIFEARGDRRA